MPEVPVRCARFFSLPRAHPHEQINEAQRNVSREGRAAEHRRRSAEERSGYMELCDGLARAIKFIPREGREQVKASQLRQKVRQECVTQ